MVDNLQLRVYGLRFTFYVSRFTVYGSKLTVYDSPFRVCMMYLGLVGRSPARESES